MKRVVEMTLLVAILVGCSAPESITPAWTPEAQKPARVTLIPDDTSTPTYTPVPPTRSATLTATATWTKTPTRTAIATETETVTATRRVTRAPTRTIGPTRTVGPTRTSRPTSIPTIILLLTNTPTNTPEVIIIPPADTPQAQACCKVCTTGKACGDSCIAKNKTCRQGKGCACDG